MFLICGFLTMENTDQLCQIIVLSKEREEFVFLYNEKFLIFPGNLSDYLFILH
jgi:hypothetical protein